MEEVPLSFSGHESFPFRNTWLTKGVMACEGDASAFTRSDAMVSLGVGKNMVQSIRHWCLATRVLAEDPTVRNHRGRSLQPTDLGRKLFVGERPWDPYLEDVGTLWLLHWLLATNPERATTWRFAFGSNHQPEFTRAGLEQTLLALAQRQPNARATRETIRRDVEVFVRSYVAAPASSRLSLEDSLDCPLTELGLLVELESHGLYGFVRGPKDTLPDGIFLFALADYARGRPEGRSSLGFGELAYDPGSPGRVFKLDEASLAERLDRLEALTDGAWQFSETAGRAQVFQRGEVGRVAALESYYRRDGSRREVEG